MLIWIIPGKKWLVCVCVWGRGVIWSFLVAILNYKCSDVMLKKNTKVGVDNYKK